MNRMLLSSKPWMKIQKEPKNFNNFGTYFTPPGTYRYSTYFFLSVSEHCAPNLLITFINMMLFKEADFDPKLVKCHGGKRITRNLSIFHVVKRQSHKIFYLRFFNPAASNPVFVYFITLFSLNSSNLKSAPKRWRHRVFCVE